MYKYYYFGLKQHREKQYDPPTAVTFADCCECIVILFKIKNA